MSLRIATFNVNGIERRLPISWLGCGENSPTSPACRNSRRADESFPAAAIRDGRLRRASGTGERPGTASRSSRRAPSRSRAGAGCPATRDDAQSRYIEAAVDGIVVGCLYLPNGNPQPGPKFDYKLAWFERLIAHAQAAAASGRTRSCSPATSTSCRPTSTSTTRSPGATTRCCSRRAARPTQRLLAQGWTDALRALHPDERIYTFWDYFRKHWPRNAGLRIDHLLLSPALAPRLRGAGVDRWVRGEPKPSDHAPTWIEIKEASTRRRATAARRRRR